MVDSACGVNGTVSEDEKERFRQKSYEVFCSDYYDNDMQPGIRASREAHDPVFVRYMPALSGDIPLYDENRVEGITQKGRQLFLGAEPSAGCQWKPVTKIFFEVLFLRC